MGRKRPDTKLSAAKREEKDDDARRNYTYVLALQADGKLALSEGVREIREEAMKKVTLPDLDDAALKAGATADLAKMTKIDKERRAVLNAQRRERRMQLKGKEQSAVERFEAIMADCGVYTTTSGFGGHVHVHSQTPSKQNATKKNEKTARAACSQEEDDAGSEFSDVGNEPLGNFKASPPYLAGTLRDYQIDGLNWMLNLHDQCLSGILADEMGLGKTFQTIALLAALKYTHQISGPHLVMCPRSVLGNWNREFARFAPSLNVFMFHAMKTERKALKNKLLDDLASTDVILTTWEQLNMEMGFFKKMTLRYLILDEGHKIKNDESTISRNVRQLNCTDRLLLTGTPLQNNLKELWALLNFLVPKLFNEADSFNDWFDAREGTSDTNVMDRLHYMLRPFMLRRIKADADAGLPPKKEVYVGCKLTRMQKMWYQNVLARDADALNPKSKGPGKQLQNVVMQLRKVCNHPFLFEGAEEGPPFITDQRIVNASGKLNVLDKLLDKLFSEPKESRQKVLVFCQMARMLDILSDYLEWKEIKFCRLDGNTSGEDRDLQMNDFNSPTTDKQVFLLSTRAGGLGINLQSASVVVLYDSDWNPQADLQAMDRAHRIGQKRPVTVFRFITDGTLEEKIYQRALKKLYLDALVVQQGMQSKKQSTKLSSEELRGMVRWGAAEVFKANAVEGEDGEDDALNVDIDQILAMGATMADKHAEEMKKNQQQTLKSFNLGIDEGNMYEFEGVDYTEKPTKSIYVTECLDIDPEAFEASFAKFGEIAKVVVSPSLDKAMIAYKDITHASKAMAATNGKTVDGAKGVLKIHYGGQVTVVTAELKAQIEARMHAEEDERKKRASARRELDETYKQELKQQEEEAAQMTKLMTNMPKFKAHPLHQFFDNDRLEELHDMEQRALVALKASRKGLSVSPAPGARSASPVPAKDEAFEPLDEKDSAEKKALIEAGFPTFSHAHLMKFIAGSAKYGRKDIAGIAAFMRDAGLSDAADDVVGRYAATFWEKGPTTLVSFETYRQRVEKGEEVFRKVAAQRKALDWKLGTLVANAWSPTAPLPKHTGLPYAVLDRYALLHAPGCDMDYEAVSVKLQTTPELFLNLVAHSRPAAALAKSVQKNVTRVVTEYEKAHEAEAPLGGAKRSKPDTPDPVSGAKKRSRKAV